MANIKGTNGDDDLVGTDGADTLRGLRGDDFLRGLEGDDLLLGGGGADRLVGWDGDDTLSGGGGDDSLTSMGGADLLNGGDGNDTIESGLDSVADRVLAGSGADEVEGGLFDQLDGGAGVDDVRLDLFGTSENIDIVLTDMKRETIIFADGTSLVGFESGFIQSGAGNDRIKTGRLDFDLNGGAGDDTLIGGAADQQLQAEDGRDVVRGGGGDDTITSGFGEGRLLDGGGGDDTIAGGPGDTLLGGAGTDRISLSFALASYDVEVDMRDFRHNGHAVVGDGTELGGWEHMTLIGGSGNDVFIGDGVAVEFGGYDGDDRLVGGAGNDTLMGGDGDDTLRGGAGDDTLVAGSGGGEVDGGAGADSIDLGGAVGGDLTLSGGAGVDRFRFQYPATEGDYFITDLEQGEIISVLVIDANPNTINDEAFTLVSQFSNVPGQAVLSYDAGQDVTLLRLDRDGDGEEDITIAMAGDHRAHTGFVL